MTTHYHIEIRGDLNHLGYKLQTMFMAKAKHISGTVSEQKNMIVIEAEGEKVILDAFVLACKQKFSEKHDIEILLENRPIEYYDDFIIL